MRLLFVHLSALFLALSLAGCSHSKHQKNPAPSWVHGVDIGVVASCNTHIKGRHYQEEMAIARAMTRLAAEKGVSISSEQLIKERVNNDQSSLNSNRLISLNIQNVQVEGDIKATWYDNRQDIFWVWMVEK